MGLVIGWFLFRLAQRFLEPPRERVAPRPLVADRLVERRVATLLLIRQDLLRVGQLDVHS